jgi:MFS transporter, MHS family, proline/betaine transporter
MQISAYSVTKPGSASSERVAARVAVAASLGHIVEYYDFAIYALLASVLAPIFFPSGDRTASLLSTFAVFGVAYLVRPLGGLIFGHLADKVGRRNTLATVILLMSGATAAVGVLPTHASIGSAAPALLVVCRSLQGLSTGGEYGGSASFVAEHAPGRRRGFYTSWIIGSTGIGLTMGALAGLVITSLLPHAAVDSWGWRVPFLIALPLGLVGGYLRLKLDESPAFTALSRSAQISEMPVVNAVRRHPRSIVQIAGLVMLLTVAIYVFFVYLPTYLTAVLGMPLSTTLPASIIGCLLFFALTPLFGSLSDRIGRKRVLIAGAVAHIALTYPAFLLLQQRSFALTVVAYVIFGAVYATYLGAFTATVTERFPAEVRAACLGIGYNLPICVFGGLAPLFLTFLIHATGVEMMPAFYVIASALISLATVLTLKGEAAPDLEKPAP